MPNYLRIASVLLFMAYLSNTASAQNSTTSSVLIRDIYSNWFNERPYAYKDCDTFYYTDRVDTNILNKVRDAFLSDKEFKEWDVNEAAYVKRKTRFTLEERRFIVQQLEVVKQMQWPAKMFPFAYMVPLEKVQQQLIQVDRSKMKPEQKICMEFQHFTPPIFLRDNSLCFFYLGKSNIFTTDGAFWIYEKNAEGEWRRLASIYEWSAITQLKYKNDIEFFQ
jgi:hypothetical protein